MLSSNTVIEKGKKKTHPPKLFYDKKKGLGDGHFIPYYTPQESVRLHLDSQIVLRSVGS